MQQLKPTNKMELNKIKNEIYAKVVDAIEETTINGDMEIAVTIDTTDGYIEVEYDGADATVWVCHDIDTERNETFQYCPLFSKALEAYIESEICWEEVEDSYLQECADYQRELAHEASLIYN